MNTHLLDEDPTVAGAAAFGAAASFFPPVMETARPTVLSSVPSARYSFLMAFPNMTLCAVQVPVRPADVRERVRRAIDRKGWRSAVHIF